MKVVILVLLLSSFLVFAEEKEKNELSIPIYYISNIEGNFINHKRSYYDVYTKLQELKNNNKDAIILNNGANFWENKNIEFLASKKNYVKMIANWLEASKFSAINIGKKDFYAPYELMSKIVRNKDFSKLNLPFLGTNIKCIKKTAPICRLLSNNFIIIERQGLKIAILSIQNPNIISKSYYKNVDGVKIEDENYINNLAKNLKKDKKIDFIILLSQLDSKNSQPQKVMGMIEKLDNIDLIITNNTKIDFIKNNKNKYIMGSSKNSYDINHIQLIKKNNKFTLKKDIIVTKIKENKALKEYRNYYNNKINVPIKNVKAEKIDFIKFYKYFLRLLVDESNSELAVVNKELLSDNLFPTNEHTYSKIHDIINYDENLVSFYMKGEILKEFLTKNKDKLLFSNVDFTKTIKINGRDIINKKYYKIATIDFLARGGDDFFTGKFKASDIKHFNKIRKILIKDLEKDKLSYNIDKFEDLSANFIWEMYSNLGLSYSKNSTNNDPNYDNAKLNKSSQEALKLNFLFKMLGTSRYNIIDNQLNINYDKTKIDRGFEESNDLIVYSFNYKSNLFKYNYDFFMVPLPYVEVKLKTEFTKSDKTDNHYFETNMSTGASFLTLNNKLEFKLGFLASKDFSYDKNEFKYNIVFGYFLDNYKIELKQTDIIFSSKLEFIQELGAKNSSTIDFYVSNNIPLWGLLYFNFRLDMFFYKDKNNDWANYYNMLTGINIIYDKWF